MNPEGQKCWFGFCFLIDCKKRKKKDVVYLKIILAHLTSIFGEVGIITSDWDDMSGTPDFICKCKASITEMEMDKKMDMQEKNEKENTGPYSEYISQEAFLGKRNK